jgi:hypothetical protein
MRVRSLTLGVAVLIGGSISLAAGAPSAQAAAHIRFVPTQYRTIQAAVQV